MTKPIVLKKITVSAVVVVTSISAVVRGSLLNLSLLGAIEGGKIETMARLRDLIPLCIAKDPEKVNLDTIAKAINVGMNSIEHMVPNNVSLVGKGVLDPA